jgi:MFS family permease
MNPASTSVDNSLLLWFLAALVYWLAAHVALGSLRDLPRENGRAGKARQLLVVGAALGCALCTGFVLTLASLGLRLMLGFRMDAGLGLFALAVVCGTAIAAWAGLLPGRLNRLGSGLALAALALGVQAGWLAAAGFRPGVPWSGKYIAAAGVLMAAGCVIALLLAFSEPAQQGRLRMRWRLAASLLLALSWLMGQEVMLAGAALNAQVGSVYQQQLTAPMLSLLAGTLVPLALLVAALDQTQRRRQRRHLDRRRAVAQALAAKAATTPPRVADVAGPAVDVAAPLPAPAPSPAAVPEAGSRRRRRYRMREI